MVDYAHALSWMIVSPIAMLTDILAIVIIAHYYPFFHGTDVMMTSLLCAMTANAALVLPIPAFMELKGMPWNPSLCIGYVWCFTTFRLAQIMSLIGISIHWSAMLKVSAERKNYFSTKTLKICTVFIWILSAVVGLLPLIGAVNEDFNKSNQCKFLGFNLGAGFAIFFLVFIVACMFVSVICAFDATILIKHMKRVAKVKYQTGRFHLPEKRDAVPTQGTCSISEKYNRLKFAWDLSRFVLFLVLLSFLGNHFPYAMIQGSQLFRQVDRIMLETVTLWLIGLESLLLPHVLWFLSRRYRHALSYVWQVYVLRRKDVEEEDPWSCMLQSYIQKDKDKVAAIPRLGQNGGTISASGTLRSSRAEIHANKDHVETNGTPPIATVSSGIEETAESKIRPNGIIQEVRFNERGIDTTMADIESNYTARGSNIRDFNELTGRVSEQAESSMLQLSVRPDIQRSSSSCSRKEWKGQMKRKQHLPPIFVNEGFDSEEQRSLRERREIARRALYQATGSSTSNSSLHYYMSSDYHPDYLTESLTKNKLNSSTESDSNGLSEQYNDSDISDVLDRPLGQSFLRRSNKKYTDSDIASVEPMPLIQQPYLNTLFPLTTEKEDSVKSEPINASGSNLLQYDMHGLPGDHEIFFDSGSIPLDEINDGCDLKIDLQHINSRYQVYERTSLAHSESPKTVPKKRNNLKEPVPTQAFYMDQLKSEQRIPLNDKAGVIEISTSFCKPKPEIDSIENSLGSTGSFSVSHLNSSLSDKEGNTHNPRLINSTSDENTDDKSTSDSNSSVTVSPYKDEERHRPWMQNLDDDDDNMLMLQMQEPLVNESDTDTLKGSHDNIDQTLNLSNDSRTSDVSTPVSSIFDDETDRGFEEALEVHVNPALSVYGGIGLCFESIKEEPEDLTSSGSNPFLDDLSNGNEQFKTQAVVSKRTESNTSSSTSMSDNLFSNSPSHSSPHNDVFRPGNNTTTIITTGAEHDFGDSGFTSTFDHVSTSDFSNHQDSSVSGKLSPWPDTDERINESDLSFESDFSETSNTDKITKDKTFFQTSSDKKYIYINSRQRSDENTFTVSTPNKEVTGHAHAKPLKSVQHTGLSTSAKKPVNASVDEIRFTERRMPVRTHSFEETSNISTRTAIVRSGSMDTPKRDVKPAYF